MESDRSETENATFARTSSIPVDEELLDSASDDDNVQEMPDRANPMLVAGKKLIPPLSNRFCARRYTGIPLQEMDDFYRYKNVS